MHTYMYIYIYICTHATYMEFSRPEHWSGKPIASPVDLHYPEIESRSPSLQADSLPTELLGKPSHSRDTHRNIFELFCRCWNLSQLGEGNCMLTTSTQTPDWLEAGGWCQLPVTSSPTRQKKAHEVTMLRYLHTIRLLTVPSIGVTQFWGN